MKDLIERKLARMVININDDKRETSVNGLIGICAGDLRREIMREVALVLSDSLEESREIEIKLDKEWIK